MRHSDESLAYKQIIRAQFSFRFGGLYLTFSDPPPLESVQM